MKTWVVGDRVACWVRQHDKRIKGTVQKTISSNCVQILLDEPQYYDPGELNGDAFVSDLLYAHPNELVTVVKKQKDYTQGARRGQFMINQPANPSVYGISYSLAINYPVEAIELTDAVKKRLGIK